MDENHLRCQICMELFDSQKCIPRNMPNCNHTFCEECVVKAINMKNKYKGINFKEGNYRPVQNLNILFSIERDKILDPINLFISDSG